MSGFNKFKRRSATPSSNQNAFNAIVNKPVINTVSQSVRHPKTHSDILDYKANDFLNISRSKSNNSILNQNTNTNALFLPQSSPTNLISKSDKYMGACPACDVHVPLTQFMIVKHNDTLSQMREKLGLLESLAAQLRREIQDKQNAPGALNSTDRSNNSVEDVSNVGGITSMNRIVSAPVPIEHEFSYQLGNLTSDQKRALSLLTTHQNINFSVTGVGSFSPQESVKMQHINDKHKDMRKKFGNGFMIGLDCTLATVSVHTKSKKKMSSVKTSKQYSKRYRQIRSFSSLNGAKYESEKMNMLRIWFSNARGFYLISFATPSEASTILHLVNIIVNNEDYNTPKTDQIVWGGYIQKKGKRVGLYTPRFLAMQGLDIKIFKSHDQFMNGEEPSQQFSLLECDFSQKLDKKEVKFRHKTVDVHDDTTPPPKDVFLCIKLNSELERDDFLNLCAQTLGRAIAENRAKMLSSPSPLASLLRSDEDSDEDEFYDEMKVDDFQRGLPPPNEDGDNINKSLFASPSHSKRISHIDSTFLRNPNGSPIELRRGSSIKHMHTRNSTRMSYLAASTIESNRIAFRKYMQQLQNTPLMYGASSIKALDRLANKKPSNIDFIETTFKGNELRLSGHDDDYIQTHQLLQILGETMSTGAFLNNSLYFHKNVWSQNKVKLVHYEEKVVRFEQMFNSLKLAFENATVDWLKHDHFANALTFHQNLVKCARVLKECSEALVSFDKTLVKPGKKKGVAKKLWNNVKVLGTKVYDNQQYRDAIRNICVITHKIEVFYVYLPSSKMHTETGSILMKDLQDITRSLMSFSNVVLADMKQFLLSYLKRGAKNIYE